jgi:hypothetical protein
MYPVSFSGIAGFFPPWGAAEFDYQFQGIEKFAYGFLE